MQKAITAQHCRLNIPTLSDLLNVVSIEHQTKAAVLDSAEHPVEWQIAETERSHAAANIAVTTWKPNLFDGYVVEAIRVMPQSRSKLWSLLIQC